MAKQEGWFITDNEGSQYRLCVFQDDDDRFFVRLEHLGEYIGEADCWLEAPDKMLLGNIIIHDRVIHGQRSLWQALIRLMLKRELKTTNYRRKGLGSALLKIVLTCAREKDLKCIYGFIYKNDAVSNPYLFEWYRKHGFTVTAGNFEGYPGAVARICLELN